MQTTPMDMLQSMPIFGAIRSDTVEFLLERTREVAVPAGNYFFKEGDDAVGMFVLQKGRVAILKDWNGRHFLLRQLVKGDCFGEMALMDLQPRSASVRAMDDCLAIELRPQD